MNLSLCVWRKKRENTWVKSVYTDVRFSLDTWRMIHVPFVPKCFSPISWTKLLGGTTSLGWFSSVWRPRGRSETTTTIYAHTHIPWMGGWGRRSHMERTESQLVCSISSFSQHLTVLQWALLISQLECSISSFSQHLTVLQWALLISQLECNIPSFSQHLTVLQWALLIS